ncbi:hypothetical protein [Legionella hackeliae]|uniref:DUF4105 domain-containing protein n=1 Tax=Legionella hackeliae TaxID=449 RepID=A0A0A8UTA1_LEGHA|nr:hypothetical protein [Legionella hackeliae]KTD11437.1 hypothetical protein Lhac_1833 [Legionella hackeliae]CEK10731.1 protein of unknown function [Legionella hackeliae]STX47481.1 Uncharacterised protein [Legionella hackeliae]
MPYFFLNYGGPGGRWWTQNSSDIAILNKACIDNYGSPTRQLTYKIKGITVTVCTYGIHRALLLHLPDGASHETDALFRQAAKIGTELCGNEYKLLSNNCVSAVAQVLNCLDKNIAANVVLP